MAIIVDRHVIRKIDETTVITKAYLDAIRVEGSLKGDTSVTIAVRKGRGLPILDRFDITIEKIPTDSAIQSAIYDYIKTKTVREFVEFENGDEEKPVFKEVPFYGSVEDVFE